MVRKALCVASVVVAALTAGCGGSGGTPQATAVKTAISGKVADGYLANASVFLDKNGNYRLDQGEPSTVTDDRGGYTLSVDPQDVGKYAIVALAVKGQTVDLDNPGQTVARSYLMSLPAGAVSGTVAATVTPFTTLMREKMEAHPGMSLSDAMAELRSQMNLPAGMDVMGDYLALGSNASSDPNRDGYRMMHAAARNMAQLMSAQADLMMQAAGTGVEVNRFRAMMGSLNVQLPQMIEAMRQGTQQSEAVMQQMAQNMEALVKAVAPATGMMPFRNMTALFPNMGGMRFWNMTGHPVNVPGMMDWMKNR